MLGTTKGCATCVYNLPKYPAMRLRFFGTPITECALTGQKLNDDNVFWAFLGCFCKHYKERT